MTARRGVGSHHGLYPNWSDDWQTPREILAPLGQFDLDPCASAHQVYKTATVMLTKESHGSGLLTSWFGRVFLNPPYGRNVGKWIERLKQHGNGIALVFARTDTSWFQEHVFDGAHGVYFLNGRLSFIRPDGSVASHNSGGPSALVAYGHANAVQLYGYPRDGYFCRLK